MKSRQNQVLPVFIFIFKNQSRLKELSIIFA